MASKRMFSMDVVGSDEFLDLPASAQNLYFHLNMRADDDGFVNNARTVTRIVGSSEDDLDLLEESGLLMIYGSVVVIRHWHVHNQINPQWYIPTRYRDLLGSLTLLSNGAYTDRPDITYRP